MEPKIRRKFKAIPITLTTSSASAATIRFDDIAGGLLLVGTQSTNATTVQIWAAADTSASTGWCRVRDDSGSAKDITLSPSSTEGRAYQLPDAVYGAGVIRLVAGSTNGTSAVCVVTLKT